METQNESKFASQKRTPRRVALKFKDEFKLPYVDGAEKNFPDNLKKRWGGLVEMFPDITLNRIYTTVSPGEIQELVADARKRNPAYQPPNFLTFFALDVSSIDIAEKLAAKLTEWEIVEYAYVESLPAPMPSSAYLDPPNHAFPTNSNADIGGIDVAYAWGKPGGTGKGVNFIDIEKGWCLDHPDLLDSVNQLKISGPLAGSINYGFAIATNTFSETQHGTSVLGILAANKKGLTWKGIAFEATGAVISPWWNAMPFPQQPTIWNVANAILTAVSNLSFGDVLLLELQVAVQNFNGLWPAECEANNFPPIELATSRGIVVVEAAGNASSDFDALTSPFNSNPNNNPCYDQDSGAIIVGAVNPQNDQFLGITSGDRFSLSNYGTRLNCFAWGDSVDTLDADPATGNCTDPLGNLLPNDIIHTTIFGGTSAAAAIIAGAAIVLQGICQQPVTQGGIGRRLSAFEMRNKLSDPNTGTLSANSTPQNPNVDKIGVMPNLKQIVDTL